MPTQKELIGFWSTEGLKHIIPDTGTEFPEGFNVLETLKKIIDPAGGVIEIGCGYGRLCRAFPENKYIGVDVNSSAIEVARQKNPGYRFETIDLATDLPKAATALIYTVALHISDEGLEEFFSPICSASPTIVIAEMMDSRWRRPGNPPVFNREPEQYIQMMARFGYTLKTFGKTIYARYNTPEWNMGRDVRLTFHIYERVRNDIPKASAFNGNPINKIESACGDLSNEEIRSRSDYQIFKIGSRGISNIGGRMQQKLQALKEVLPKFNGLRVLDIGCDFGFWSFTATLDGAEVIGLDRSRPVKDMGQVNIPLLNNQTAKSLNLKASFLDYEAGTQWWDFGKFDVVLCMSLYHHIYNICRDHESIWYWLSRVTGKNLIWENPANISDSVVQINVTKDLWPFYTENIIRDAALKYFDIDYEGPALHETSRVIWRLQPKKPTTRTYQGTFRSGTGGASKAFAYSNNRRINEIQRILGKTIISGSLNLILDQNFDWDSKYLRARLLDVVDRRTGLIGQWAEKWVRFYPLLLGDVQTWAMRFEGERYPLNFVELLSDQHLKPLIGSDKRVSLTSY